MDPRDVRDFALWLQLSVLWSDLANISKDAQRTEFHARAATCLNRARRIRTKIEASYRKSPEAGAGIDETKPGDILPDGIRS